MKCMWTSPWIWFAVDATVHDFRECFEKSLYRRNLLLTIQNLSLLPRDIRFSTNEGFVCTRMCRRFPMFAQDVVCVCGGGEMYLLLVRGVSGSKTLIPLILSQSGWMLFITTINNYSPNTYRYRFKLFM